jgi:hypothetical protein
MKWTAMGWVVLATSVFGTACGSSEPPAPEPGNDGSVVPDAGLPDTPAVPDTGADTTNPTGDAGCVNDMGCAAPTPRCNLGTRTCVACLSGATDNCPSGQFCDATALTCKPGCKANADCAPGACSPDHACVECMPGANDSCPVGKYCSAAITCVPGCKNDAACSSGKCLATHDCASCLSDSECAEGRVCATGQCIAPCTTKNDCPAGFDCCGNHCADTKRDPRHCGSCDAVCTVSQFCGPTACTPAIMANICDSPKASFLLDGLSIDDAATATIQAGLAAQCAPAPTMTAVDQKTSGFINPTTGKPVAFGGNLLVVVGGPFGQLLIKYLETSGIAPVYNYYDANVDQLLGRRTDDAGADPFIVNAMQSQITESHSYFLVEMVLDSASGTLTFVVYGISASGTQAAAWYFVNKMLPTRSTLMKSWYVYEWTDQDADKKPGDADTFTLVQSSP